MTYIPEPNHPYWSAVDMPSTNVEQPATKLSQHDQAVRDVLLARGTIYAAGGDDHATARLAGSFMRLLMSDLVLDDAQLFYCCKEAEKAARAITGGLGGVYHGDNGLDLSGYEALLAAVSSGKDLYDVLPQ